MGLAMVAIRAIRCGLEPCCGPEKAKQAIAYGSLSFWGKLSRSGELYFCVPSLRRK
jgi:hypothetical protein